MGQYKTVFILALVLSDEQMKKTVVKFKKLPTDNGAEILNEEAWGMRKLAYQAQEKNSGFYYLFEFEGKPTLVQIPEAGFRRDEKVIRYTTVKLDKYVTEHALRRKQKYANGKEA